MTRHPLLKATTVAAFAILAQLFASAPSLNAQITYTGTGLWTELVNWDSGALLPDGSHAVVNGICEIDADFVTQHVFNPGRITVGLGATGSLHVSGGILSGAHGGGSGVFVGSGAGGDGTLIIDQGATFRSQGANMGIQIGDDAGGVGFVSVAGELQNYKFLQLLNGTLEMMPTGINNKFNSNNPSFIGPNGTLSFIIDGTEIGALEKANSTGLQLTIDPSATLQITLGGSFQINDSWTLMSYTVLSGQFAQGTSFVNQQGYTFDVDYGTGSADVVTLTLTSDDDRPVIDAFTATPASSAAGQPVTLTWDASNFDTLSIDQAVGDVTAQGAMGSVQVNPTQTTTYTLSADLGGVVVTAETTVVVDELPVINAFTATPARISVVMEALRPASR